MLYLLANGSKNKKNQKKPFTYLQNIQVRQKINLVCCR